MHPAVGQSVRVMRSGVGYVNFCAVESAIQARERYAGQRVTLLIPEASGPEAEKELQVTFTTAQQLCRRRVGVPVGLSGRGGGRGVGGMQMGGEFGGRGKGGGFENGGKGKGGLGGS